MMENYKYEINWIYCLRLVYLNLAGFYAIFVAPPTIYTIIYLGFLAICSVIGTSAGAHRCFSHRSYKPNMKLKVLLVLFQTLAAQRSIIEWSTNHRVHHKYNETFADPYNTRHGFLFAHFTWICYKLHPEYEKQKSKIDMRDLENDNILRFQHKYYELLVLVLNFIIPMIIGCAFFGESKMTMWHYNALRIVITHHISFSLNSFGHIFGTKPYDSTISAVDSKIYIAMGLGEGWHNFHHTFPSDYRSSENNSYWLNAILAFIDFFGWLGWATDFKVTPHEVIKNRILRTGDGSHQYSKEYSSKHNKNPNKM